MSTFNDAMEPELETKSDITLPSPIPRSPIKHDFGFIPIPERCQYNAKNPVTFDWRLKILFAFTSTFVVANLYYCQPLLVQMSEAFEVDYDRVSRIPTLTQAGYAAGLLLISPLGDLIRRRPLVLALVFSTTLLSVGLALAKSAQAFEAISFVIGALSVPAQVLIPLAVDLSTPEYRARSLSIVLSGLLLGILVARVLGGLIAQFATYRDVFWMATGLQGGILSVLWLLMPDVPAKAEGTDLTYLKIIWTMIKFVTIEAEPILIQCTLGAIATNAVFSGFWVTLTFLLNDAPYHYNTFKIGLFGLVGILAVVCVPFIGKIVDRMVPWTAAMYGYLFSIIACAIYIGLASVNLAGVILPAMLIDLAQQLQQVSNSVRVQSISPPARARLNAIFIIGVFIGQVIGTEASTSVILKAGARATGGLWLGLMALTVILYLVRGPHAPRKQWFGWAGQYSIRKRNSPAQEIKRDTEKA